MQKDPITLDTFMNLNNTLFGYKWPCGGGRGCNLMSYKIVYSVPGGVNPQYNWRVSSGKGKGCGIVKGGSTLEGVEINKIERMTNALTSSGYFTPENVTQILGWLDRPRNVDGSPDDPFNGLITSTDKATGIAQRVGTSTPTEKKWDEVC